MYYYSTNKDPRPAKLQEAVINGLAPDKGLYFPRKMGQMQPELIKYMIDKNMSLQDIAFFVAARYFGEDIRLSTLEQIVNETLNFEIPLRQVNGRIYSLELFHGPTLAFKDVGARFMARLLQCFVQDGELVNVLVATSGDTGSAVANGFLGVEGIRVYVLYPKGKVSKIQAKQFTTLGQNITALEVDGNFDDCQALVKAALADPELRTAKRFTTANSINIARLIPQIFYYVHAYAQFRRLHRHDQVVFSVPCGNLGNLTAGLMAWDMGLDINLFIGANNNNKVLYTYLKSHRYRPMPAIPTIANAMDVGDPSNFARLPKLFYGKRHLQWSLDGSTSSDEQIKETIREVYTQYNYLLDPHGACAYRALTERFANRYKKVDGEFGIFLETAHPAKFVDTMQSIINAPVPIPDRLKAFMRGKNQSVAMSKDFAVLKEYLLSQ